MAHEEASDPYQWSEPTTYVTRLRKPGRGIYHDVRRRLPYYWSDWRDGLTYRSFAGCIRIYFVNLLPALAFILDMNHNTGGFFGVNEALLSSALACFVFSLFSAQPLTVVGITGLISLFNYTIYHILQRHDITIYARFMPWVGIWAGLFHWLVAVLNLEDYMRTVTDFSSQTFALYVGTIYLIKGVEELSVSFYENRITNGFASCTVAILFTLTIYGLENLNNTTFVRGWLRTFLADYAYPIATIWWTGFSHIPGNILYASLDRLPVTRAFYPNVDRAWIVDFWNLDAKWICIAIPFGFAMTLLFYYDHNISSLTAQARQFPLKKPAGFHWDFFLLGCTCVVAGVLNIPLPNGLVPQAPVHTDALATYTDHAVLTEDKDGNKRIHKETIAEKVEEQRVSHFLMFVAIMVTMTGPFLVVLHTIPRALFAGVFFIVGWGSIGGNEICNKILYLLQEPRFRQPDHPLNDVPKRKILLFIGFQLACWASCVAISQTIGAIGFPVLILSLVPIRWKCLPRLFTADELGRMDELTATNEVVLVSLGGKPELPEGVVAKRKENNDVEAGVQMRPLDQSRDDCADHRQELKRRKIGGDNTPVPGGLHRSQQASSIDLLHTNYRSSSQDPRSRAESENTLRAQSAESQSPNTRWETASSHSHPAEQLKEDTYSGEATPSEQTNRLTAGAWNKAGD